MPSDLGLTIVIPHLNNPEGLDRCLSALTRQVGSLPGFEVIVVDNGSAALPQAVCDKYEFARLIQEPTPGPGPARTTGAGQSGADLLAFIDSDCIAGPEWIATITDYFDANPKADVIGGDVRIARVDPSRPTSIECYEGVYGYRMALYVARDHYTATCNMAVRRAVFEKVGAFAGIEIAEDVDWGRRATAIGMRIDYVPQMQIATPARGSFQELTRKWDRHIGHDHAELSGLAGRLKWVVRAGALLISPLAEIAAIVRSDRLTGVSERMLAFACLTRIRLYRGWQMLRYITIGKSRATRAAWRQDT